jgi:hypothetical protein
MVEISPGELLDRVSILRIKTKRIADPSKLANVRKELDLLARAAEPLEQDAGAAEIYRALEAVNERLWDIEDDIRVCEKKGDFGPSFIALARSVYMQNDERAALKRRLNDHFGSSIVEEKSYA